MKNVKFVHSWLIMMFNGGLIVKFLSEMDLEVIEFDWKARTIYYR